MNTSYDTPYTSLTGLAIIDPATATLVAEVAGQLAKFLGNMGITNDNGVIAARDKIANYVTQVMGDRTLAYKTLYTGYQLAHSDINNVGTKSYYVAVLERLNKAVINYILTHAQDSNEILEQEYTPEIILGRYTDNVKSGMKLDHAFWMAFTGRKDPYDIRTGNALPTEPDTHTDPYKIITDASGVVTQVKDAYGNVFGPGTPEYNAAINKKEAGFFSVPSNIAIALVGGALLLSAGAYAYNKYRSTSKK